MSPECRLAVVAVGLALSLLLLAGSRAGRTLAGTVRPALAATPATRTPVPAPPPPTAGGDARPGADLYALHCASCHGSVGQGTPDGIPLAGIGAAAVDFVVSTGRMPLSYPHESMMRRESAWTRTQIDDIVAFVTSLAPGGLPVPAVHPETGDLALGGRIYAQNCAPCHGASGQGAAVGGGADAPNLYPATPVQVAEAVRIGPDPMPRFDSTQINAHELDSLVRYVTFLPRLPDSGGFSLGHIGPVAEGFVAWIVGLGLIVAIIRLIGTPN